MKHVALVTLSIVSIAALAYAAAQAKQLQQANYRISQLEREQRVTRTSTAASLRDGARATTSEPSKLEPAGPPTTSLSSSAAAPASNSSPGSKLSLAEWRMNQQLEEIEQYIALNDEQREGIRQALDAATQAPSGSNPQDQESLKKIRQQAVTTVIGEEAAQQLERDLARQEQETLAQELDSETFSLSRKLQLTAEQEEHLRTALSYTQTFLQQEKVALSNKMSEAMAQHFDQDPERSQLRELYQEIKSLSTELNTKKYTALVEQLSGILSPDQLKALMAQQSQQ